MTDLQQEIVEVEELATTLTVDEDISTFNETAYRIGLAALYGVPVEYIVLDAAAGSLVLNVKIQVTCPCIARRRCGCWPSRGHVVL